MKYFKLTSTHNKMKKLAILIAIMVSCSYVYGQTMPSHWFSTWSCKTSTTLDKWTVYGSAKHIDYLPQVDIATDSTGTSISWFPPTCEAYGQENVKVSLDVSVDDYVRYTSMDGRYTIEAKTSRNTIIWVKIKDVAGEAIQRFSTEISPQDAADIMQHTK